MVENKIKLYPPEIKIIVKIIDKNIILCCTRFMKIPISPKKDKNGGTEEFKIIHNLTNNDNIGLSNNTPFCVKSDREFTLV